MTADFFLVCVRMVARAVHVFFSFMRIHYLRSKFYRNVFCAENTNHHFRFIAKKKFAPNLLFKSMIFVSYSFNRTILVEIVFLCVASICRSSLVNGGKS